MIYIFLILYILFVFLLVYNYQNHLSYNPDQATAVKNSQKDDASASDLLQKKSDLDIADRIAQASNVSPPDSGLPRKTLEHIQKGMQLTEEGKHNQGNLEFEKAAQISPNSPELFSIWGAALRMQKKYKGANKKFARAHELVPQDEEILINWGMSRLEEDQPDEAITLFKKAIQINPKNHMTYNFLGKSYGRKKMYPEETDSYRKAIALEPEFAQSHFNLGIVLSLQKKFEDAAPHFKKAIALDKQFEKPFVIQMLTALGLNDAAPKENPETEPKKPEPVKEAKATPAPAEKKEEKKSEGSDHKMEGSKNTSETTTLQGKILVNGAPLPTSTVVFLETKSKLRVPDQKMVELAITQSDLQFLPKHTVVPIGSTITFMNQDKEVHNIFSKSQSNQFNLGAMASGTSKSIKFSQGGPIILRCNLHKDMIGTLFVVPNGYYTHPNAAGDYKFDQVKSQGYLLEVWHPQLYPTDVEANLKPIDLNGTDQTINLNTQSASKPGEIHDMVDPTDYNAIVDTIEKEMFQAIEDWKNGKKSIPRKRMLMVITKHFDGEGLKGAIAKSFSEKRSLILEKKLDDIRKQLSGIEVPGKETTEASLKSEAKFAVSQLRNNVRELETRLNPDGGKE